MTLTSPLAVGRLWRREIERLGDLPVRDALAGSVCTMASPRR
jgi:hypothetical protein